MLVRSITSFLSILLLMSRYSKYIFRRISYSILGLLFFAPLRLRPDTFIIPLLDVHFFPFTFASYLFKLSMILQAYYIVKFEFISSKKIAYKMKHLLQIIYKADWIFWGYVCNFHFHCCQNVNFFVAEKVSWSSNFAFGCCKSNNFSNYLHLNVSRFYEVPQVLQRNTLKWWKEYIKGPP